MPTFAPPKCLDCKFFIGDRDGTPKCMKYTKIPDKIYWEAGDCKFFEPREQPAEEPTPEA